MTHARCRRLRKQHIPLPCNPAAETALQPLIWCSESLSSPPVLSSRGVFFTDTGIALAITPATDSLLASTGATANAAATAKHTQHNHYIKQPTYKATVPLTKSKSKSKSKSLPPSL